MILNFMKKNSVILILLVTFAMFPLFQSCDNEPVDRLVIADSDGDGVPNNIDNCVSVANPDQMDEDNDGIGDACDEGADIDTDGDSIPDIIDNCVDIANTDQADDDNDGIGNACDSAPITPLFICEDGMAGPYPCNNYDLLAHIPVSVLANTMGTPEGSDIWGWTDPATGKEYALVATTNSTAFVDVTIPTAPVFLGRLDTSAGTNFWRDVKVYNNYAFIVADGVGPHGMQVFDLTRLRDVTSPPVDFTSDALYSEFGSAHNIVINEDSGYAYVVGTSRGGTYEGGPLFINIQNPTNPIGEGGFNGYAHDAQVVTYTGPDSDYSGREILVGSNENEVVIADVIHFEYRERYVFEKGNSTCTIDFEYNNKGFFGRVLPIENNCSSQELLNSLKLIIENLKN